VGKQRTPALPIPQPSAEIIRRREADEAALREGAREVRRAYLDSLDPRQRAMLSYADERA